MLRFTARAHLTGGDIQRGDEVEGAVANVVMRLSFRLPDVHREDRLRPLKRLDLRLLVEREHHGIRRRSHIQPDDVAHLFDELRVRRHLERVGEVRFETTRPPDAADGRVAHPALAAIVRVLQCVSPGGVVSSVFTITASTSSSEIVRGAPTRGSS